MKTSNVILLACLLFAAGCGSPQRTNLMEYELSPTQANAGDLRAPTESGGRIDIGADDVKAGHPNSRATKTLSCGDRNKCKFLISAGSRAPANHNSFVDNEKIQVAFTWGTTGNATDTYGTDETYPQIVELPTCGPVTVTITMTEGDTPGVKSWGTVGPLEYWCE
jgi:hypothetical protein